MFNNKNYIFILIILLLIYPVRLLSLYGTFHLRPLIDMPPKEIKKEDIRFCIISPGYNIEKEIVRTLDSVKMQNYHNWKMYLINDQSNDKTEEIAKKYITDNKLGDQVKLKNNSQKLFHLGGMYTYIHKYCNDNDVVVLLDADDYLYTPYVLSKLYYVYKNPNTWITSSRYISLDTYKTKIRKYDYNLDKDKPRSKFQFGHLRAFRAWLFKKLDKKWLIEKDKKFFCCASDVAIYIPMVELAARGHYKHLDNTFIVYDDVRSLNEHKVHHDDQTRIRNLLLKRKKLRPLENPNDIAEIWK